MGRGPQAYAEGITATVGRKLMKALVIGLAIAAVGLFVLGLAVNTLGFLIGVAPVLLAAALVLLLLSRFRGRRIPR
ncbi:hypothetical protein CXX84_03380 [Arthrobacter sp. AFG7.2]|nr:hypothetical protein CXX84_03380 [Arthrobacter sp. AFG7.2]